MPEKPFFGIRPTVNLLAMLYTCANGRLPWDGGPDWDPSWDKFMPLCEKSWAGPARYILCCEHTISPGFAERLIAAKIMEHGELDRVGRPTITIGEVGARMLAEHLGRLERAYPELSRDKAQ